MAQDELITGLLEAINAGLILLDSSARITHINSNARKILELEDRNLPLVSLAGVLPETEKIVETVLQTGQCRHGQLLSDGEMDLAVDISPIRVSDQITGVVCLFYQLEGSPDSAGRLNSFEMLNQQINAIFNFSSDGMWVSDGQGAVLKINRASEELNGIRSEDVVGSNIRSVIERGIIDKSATLEVLSTRKRAHIIQHVPRTGKDLLLTGTPLFDSSGEISLVVVNERDMTQLNAMKADLVKERQLSRKYKDELMKLHKQDSGDEQIISGSVEMREVLNTAEKLAGMGVSNILILGESGAGKGLMAKMIHNRSSRSDHPFIQINCAALPESLLEAELFGYESGAFTGAQQKGKAGLFELARNGTLFLDEIAEMPISAQAKLLKYLDDQEVQRLGGTKSTHVDCTIIAATNQDLETRVKNGDFRKDLFYRLNTFTLRIPPLRERPDDVFELVTKFVDIYNKRYGLKRRASAEALAHFQKYPFPGNVRELKSIIKKAVVMSESDNLDKILLEAVGMAADATGGNNLANQYPSNLPEAVDKLEKELLMQAIEHCKTTRQMAEYLGISQPTVVRKMKHYGLPPLIHK